MIMDSCQTSSLFISDLLGQLGYSYDMIKYRQRMYNYYDSLARSPLHVRITTGGKGEGINFYYESDIDYIHIVRGVICAHNPQDFNSDENISLFKMDMETTPPGYTKLKLLKCDAKAYKRSIIASLISSDKGETNLSSELFTNDIKKYIHDWCLRNEVETYSIRGPSNPTSFRNVTIDNVWCFKCYCHKLLQQWGTRPRTRGWPSPEHVKDIYDMDGYVVPVGCKGSPTENLEWRICYTSAELYLMKNLNETQLKVYIILKNMAKTVFRPISEDITSYIMKNIILWQCEALGLNLFVKYTLLERVADCLRHLKRSMEDNHLSSYFIPDRNLLAGKLDINQRTQIIHLINDYIHQGNIFQFCDMLRGGISGMIDAPDVVKEFGKKRKRVEMLVLTKKMIILEMRKARETENETEQELILSRNERYIETVEEIEKLINFDFNASNRKGKSSLEAITVMEERLTKLLS